MKKNNSLDGTFKELLYKYRLNYFLGFAGVFILLMALMALFVLASTSRLYLSDAKDRINTYIASIDNTDKTAKNFVPSDQRMITVYYLEDANDSNQMHMVIYGIESSENDVKEAYRLSAAKGYKNIGKFVYGSINDIYNVSYSSKIENTDNPSLKIGGENIKYIKVYMNVDGEFNSRKEFFASYIIISIIIAILSIFVATVMSVYGLKPIKTFMQKQIDFVNDASHELRTPLAVVQSKAENALADPNKTVYDVSEDFAVILNEINRLRKLTEELLTLARNDKNATSYNYSKVELNSLLNAITEPFIEIAMIQERTLSYQGEECYALVDPDKIKQIMIVILDNAIKYTMPNDTIDVILSCTNNEIFIDIKDSGIGISEETKEHIFDRFYREDKARSRETGGNGLGLSIAKTLVNAMKGKISVDHNMPKGTVFTIEFSKYKENKKDQNSVIL